MRDVELLLLTYSITVSAFFNDFFRYFPALFTRIYLDPPTMSAVVVLRFLSSAELLTTELLDERRFE